MSNTASQRGSSWKTWVLSIVMTAIITVMLLVLAGVFHRKVPSDAASVSKRSAEGLKTAIVRSIQRPRFETASGTVQPVHEASVASRLLARVIEIPVTAGQTVSKGDVLVKLDDADLQARLRQSEASLTQAQTAKEKADADLARAEQLKTRQAISQADYDGAKSAHQVADASVERSKQAVAEAQVMLDHATIQSPMNGTIVDKRVEAGDTVGPGEVLLTLFEPDHMQMVASVRESLALKLRPGQTIPTRLDALDLECEATISEVVPAADAATRSFTVKVTGPCPPGAYSGMFGRLLLPQGEETIIVVPSSAIVQVGQLTMVDVVEGTLLTRRYIRTGRVIESDVEVLAGLKDGDVVAVK